MSSLALCNIYKRFGPLTTIHGVDLEIAEGEFVVFVGPSGCGKSTLLRMIAGLEDVSEGTIHIGGTDVTNLAPRARNVAMVFQSYALYPHMTVRENLTFGMRMRKEPRDAIEAKLKRAVEMLELQPYLDRKPAQLSGGQAQRVAIGRALVHEPAIFLFDEPLSNLDAELRLKMRVEIGALHQSLKKTMIYVTHDQVEAMTLANRIVVLREGRIEQVGAPLALYRNPVNQFVGGFIGSPAMNFLPFDVLSAHAPEIARLGAATVGVRPEHFAIEADGPLRATVKVVERLGANSFVYADFQGMTLCIDAPNAHVQPGDAVRLVPHADWLYVFDAAGRTISALK
jgi:ABC-type sugar transport system ATPase subunit